MAKNPRLKNLSGQRFGRWEVLHQSGNLKGGGALWLCRCDCGNSKNVVGADLRSGKSKSCGCARIEKVRQPLTHGGSRSRLHRIWKAMRNRCLNENSPSYKNYGGRGISICSEWEDFASFREWANKNGYDESLSIERIDVDGNYSPSNCTWADALTQSSNRRYTRKRDDGQLWWHIAQSNGITKAAYRSRLYDGWPIEEAATRPMRQRQGDRPR